MRSRNIKPGFFKNETLAELTPSERLFFIGLWCLADREGRLENRPKRLQIEIFPYDDFAPVTALEHLQKSGFIELYKVGGSSYIQILNFRRHQNPHKNEADSVIPAIRGTSIVNYESARVIDGTTRADSLIPDSLFKERKEKKESAPIQPAATANPKGPTPAASWAPETAPGLDQVKKVFPTARIQAQTPREPNWEAGAKFFGNFKRKLKRAPPLVAVSTNGAPSDEVPF